MSLLFGGGGQKQRPQYTGIQLQTSSSTVALGMYWGMNRGAPNLVWYDDFKVHKEKQKTGGKGAPSSTVYTYSASVILVLCEGPIEGVSRVFRDQEKRDTIASIGLSLFTGEDGQAVWGYLSSAHPDEALNYSGVAYLAAANYDLGNSASLPNHGFEIQAKRYNTAPGGNGDALIHEIVNDFLTSSNGVGFRADLIDYDTLDSGPNATTTGDGAFETYCRALGFGMSPFLSDQEEASQTLGRWARLTNTALVWTGYSLQFIPYGEDEVTGNGYHYVPGRQSEYDLNDDDFVAEEGPVLVSRTDPSDVNNSLKLQFKDRANEYNPAPVEWKDQGLIDQFGLRTASNIEANEVCEKSVAASMVVLIGQREAYVRNQYQFTLPPEYILLLPMSIVTVRDPKLGDVLVQITKIKEDEEDGTLEIEAEEMPGGVTSLNPPDFEGLSGLGNNTAVAPSPVNPPVIFEPPSSLTAGQPQVWIAVSGGDGTNYDKYWGGCNVYASSDGATYRQIGTVQNPAIQGSLSAALADYTSANPDTVHTLSVDVSQSGGELDSVSAVDAEGGVNLCRLETGEFISFQDATLTGTFAYDLTNLWRGMYGSDVQSASSGDGFARIDETIFKFSLPPDFIGTELSFKFQSFNAWGNSAQDLSDCVEYAYTPAGVVPAAPVGLSLVGGGSTWVGDRLNLLCSPVDGATSYRFWFYEADGTTLVVTMDTSSSGVSYRASDALRDGAQREYVVYASALNSNGTGPLSDPITITNVAPPAITGESASGGATTASVSWSASADTDLAGYVVYFDASSGFDPKTDGSLLTVGTALTSASIYGLSAGTYYAVVAAYDAWSFDPDLLNFSAEVSFTITAGGGSGPPSGGGFGGGYGGVPTD